jgi:hypothetical protein
LQKQLSSKNGFKASDFGLDDADHTNAIVVGSSDYSDADKDEDTYIAGEEEIDLSQYERVTRKPGEGGCNTGCKDKAGEDNEEEETAVTRLSDYLPSLPSFSSPSTESADGGLSLAPIIVVSVLGRWVGGAIL